MGPDLMDNLRKQAERFGAELVADDVVEVDLQADPKVVKTATDTYHAKTVILATGSGYRELGVPNEKRLSGHGVSWCATCDGFFFRDQDIVVVGGGDTAMEEATFLTRFARSVTVVHRRAELRASKIMQDRAFANEKIRFVWDSEVVDVLGDAKVSGVRLRNVKTGEESELAATGLFIAIGHDPRTELLKGQIELDEEGYIKVDAPSTRTSADGVFAAGDVVDHTYRQAITAAGTVAPPRSTPSAGWPTARADPTDDPDTEITKREQDLGRHQERDRRQLRRRRPEERQARSRRLLGRVVRPVPPGRPDPGGDRR